MAGMAGGIGGVAPPGTQWDPTRGGYVPVGAEGQQPGAGTTGGAQNPNNINTPAQFAPVTSTINGRTSTDPSSALVGLQNQTATQTQAEEALAAQAGGIAQSATAQSAALQAAAEQRRMQMLEQFSLQNGTAGAPGAPVAPVDLTAANAAAFAQAKDQSGLLTQGALTGLRDAYAGTGNVGGFEQGAAQAVGGGAAQLGDTVRAQAVNQAATANQTVLANQQAGLTQRGQNLQQQQAILGLITSRALY